MPSTQSFHRNSPPSVLLFSTERWFALARLAMALKSTGFIVDVCCPSGHPARAIQSVRRVYPYLACAVEASIARALSKAGCDLVIPCDDLAMLHLHRLHNRVEAREPLASLIRRSLGDPRSFAAIERRHDLIEMAGEEGIAAPDAAPIASVDELLAWLQQHGFPAVVKADGSSGGLGVRVVRSPVEARLAYAALRRPPVLAKAAKRLLIDHDGSLMRPSLLRQPSRVNVQSFVHGSEASSSVACWQGRMLSVIHFKVIRASAPYGPASVIQVFDSPQMSVAAEKMVRRLHLSGLCGFDFMIDSKTKEATLIEMNARATQTCHLRLGVTHDLVGALWSAITGRLPSNSYSGGSDVVALFPQEFSADPNSRYLQEAYHDVPWSEPSLMRACLSSCAAQEKWYSTDKLASLYAKLPWHRA